MLKIKISEIKTDNHHDKIWAYHGGTVFDKSTESKYYLNRHMSAEDSLKFGRDVDDFTKAWLASHGYAPLMSVPL